MLTYTKGTLKASLSSWNVTSDPDFAATRDEIIRKGELRLAHLLDLDSLDSVGTTTTAGTVPEVFKPDNLIIDRMLVIDPVSSRKQIIFHRHRGWIELMNADDEEGVPKYYADFDEERWFVTPIPNAAYLIYVHGLYRPASIVDGNDDNETWFSTRVPELLWLACSIEANEFLKNWARKASNEAELIEKSQRFLGIAASLQRSDYADLVGGMQNQNKPSTQPAGT